MKHSFDTIQTTLKKHFPTLREEFGVSKIGIFGSVIQERATKKSDVDLVVEFSQTPGFFKFMKLENYLANILKRKIDLVTKPALKTTIKDDILHSTRYV